MGASELLTLSDRRLKTNIRGLREAVLREAAAQRTPSWILRQLRPVSFRFKNDGPNGKQEGKTGPERYGFVADEVERVVPEVVRTISHSGRDDVKAVAYNDLIAL